MAGDSAGKVPRGPGAAPAPGRPGRGRAAAKEETREALVLAGLAEFAERGLDIPSLDAISARAGFTRGAFYVHFRDRDEFLDAVMERVFGAFLDAVLEGGGGSADLDAAMDRFAAMLDEAGSRAGRPGPAMAMHLHHVLDACARSPRLAARFSSMLAAGASRLGVTVAAGQEDGRVRRDVDAATVAEVLAVLALGAVAARGTGMVIPAEAAVKLLRRLLAPPAR